MTTVTSVAVAQGGELVEGGPQDQYCLDGDRADLGVYPINTNITETLVRLTPDFEVVPGLAERWCASAASTARTPECRFDGSPLSPL